MSNEKPILKIPADFDEMTDAQYKNFYVDWQAFHNKHYPIDTIFPPKMETLKYDLPPPSSDTIFPPKMETLKYYLPPPLSDPNDDTDDNIEFD
jgi:hypothetical protein